MLKNFLRGVVLVSLGFFIYGCASKGIEVRSYIEDKPRVDQEMKGNAGYLTGTPAPEGPKKQTRRIYVLEVSKEAETTKEEAAALAPEKENTTTSAPAPSTSTVKSLDNNSSFTTNVSPQIKIPSFDDVQPSAPGSSSKTVEYKVDKDDTLQKIAKKFYNSYGQWTKIYAANKEKIKDPDHIQPGIVLTIPLE